MPNDLEYALMEPIFVDFFEAISQVVDESFGGYNYDDDCEKCLYWTDSG
jgi:hypothetical protein